MFWGWATLIGRTVNEFQSTENSVTNIDEAETNNVTHISDRKQPFIWVQKYFE